MTVFDTRRFLSAKIKEANPDIEQRSGSSVGTMLIKPMSVMLTPFDEEVQYIKTQLSLADVASLGSDNVDQLVENLFLNRKTGSLSDGEARLYFSSSQDKAIPEGSGFIDTIGQIFITIERHTISDAEMSLNVDGSLYYMDVPLVSAEPGESYNIDVGLLVSPETDIVGLVRLTNLNPFTSGIGTETDDDFVERAQEAITVRNLINRRSISTVLLDEFNFIQSIESIGFRDPEMIRDIIDVVTTQGAQELHVGGHADIYIEPLSSTETTVNITDAAMSGELIINTNKDRGSVTQSVKPGLHIDMAPGFFGVVEVEEQLGIKLDQNSTYYIYLDSANTLQFDKVSVAFPSNSTPISIVVTAISSITSVTDSRQNVIEFPRPVIGVESVFELDPATLTETDRVLTDGRALLYSAEVEDTGSSTLSDADLTVVPTDDVFSVSVLNDKLRIHQVSSDGVLLSIFSGLDSALGSSRSPTISHDSLGRLHLVFENDSAGSFDVYHARLSQAGTIEVAAASISGATTGVSYTRHDLDETGNIHAVWVEGTDVYFCKRDIDGVSVIAPMIMSVTALDKSGADISTNGNSITNSTTGEASGDTSFEDLTTNFPGTVAAGQTLVLGGGSLDYSAILDGTETEPPAFAAFVTASISSTLLDTSTASGFNTFDVVVDGIPVNVPAFTDSPVTPIATVISEINVASNLTALAVSIASNSGTDEVVITSPTTGIASTVNMSADNLGIGFTATDSDQGGTGYDTSVVNGTNVLDITVDSEALQIVFTDVKGNSLANVVSAINVASLASPLAANVATVFGSLVRITSPTNGLTSGIEVVAGNAALGFVDADREEGGSELGRRIGITAVVGPTEITLAEIIRTVSTSGDILYLIESIESGIVWTEDSDVHIAKVNDSSTIFVTDTDITSLELQASAAATPTTNALEDGPSTGEVTLEDTSALFITNSVGTGSTVRVTTATPSSAQDDYLVARVISETELVLVGTLPSSPANSITYEVFETHINARPRITTNTDNESQVFLVVDGSKIARIELDRLGVVLADNRAMITRPYVISYLDSFTDTSDYTHLTWSESIFGSGDVYMAKTDELGDVTLDVVETFATGNIARYSGIHSNSENEPVIMWVDTDFSISPTSPSTRLMIQKRSAQDYFIKISDPSVNLSVKEDNAFIFTKEFLGQPIGVKYQTSADIQTVENYLQAPDNQVIDSNYLAKHTIRSTVSTDISYTGEVTDPQAVVVNFINGVTSASLEASDIADALYAAGATQVVLPFTMSMTYTDIDGTFNTATSQDALEVPRVARYFASSSTISVTNVG